MTEMLRRFRRAVTVLGAEDRPAFKRVDASPARYDDGAWLTRQDHKLLRAVQGLRIEQGGARDAPLLLALFDDAVRWLVARGQAAQWGSEPFSADPAKVARVHGWAAGSGFWLACGDDRAPAGAIVLGDAPGYVPPATVPELYVQVLLTATAWRGRGVGALLIDHAAALARADGAERLRVDCWDGVPELPASYERLGFARVGSFAVGDWPGAILELELQD